ncbi:spore coat protein [Rossellomorea marisflavi]|uniref:spore coat protein n=1 Tax=Rossellomorea marisflavi TaxID=189381 RepID=UPI003AD86CCF
MHYEQQPTYIQQGYDERYRPGFGGGFGRPGFGFGRPGFGFGRPFWGGPFIGGLAGGLLGASLLTPGYGYGYGYGYPPPYYGYGPYYY